MKKSINITLKNNTEKEQSTGKLLELILSKYNLEKWILCREVLIEEGIKSHSYPKVTLSAKPKTENQLLAVFLHEQIHWIEEGRKELMIKAVEELKNFFPNVPVGKPAGADSEKSTYRHLVICRIEFLALKESLKEKEARETVLGNSAYTWIRRTAVEEGFKIDLVIEKYFPDLI